MNSFDAEQQLLPPLSPEGDSSSLAIGWHVAARRDDWLRVGIEVANDWITVALAMTGGDLAWQRLSIEGGLHRSLATIFQLSLCVASLTVFLLANDGAYRGIHGPLRIREIEHSIRVAVQASVLVFLVSLVVGSNFPRAPIESSLVIALLFLIVEKKAFSLLFSAFAARVMKTGAKTHGRWSRLIQNLSPFALHDADEDRKIRQEMRVAGGRSYEVQKRILDLLFATTAIVLTSPVWLIIAALVAADSPGGALFIQQRVGKNGRLFRIYKFRSMHADADRYALSPNNPADPRLTRSGSILRKCSLDELPQLLNVLKGEMALVGPRPEMPFLVNEHGSEHQQRLQVLPGITGLWQLSPARGSRIHENVHYDRYYILNRSLCMDLAILLYTPVRLMRGI